MYCNQDMSTAALVSNILRNGALHLGTPSKQINQHEQRTLQMVLGSQLNDPKTTLGTSFNIPYSRHEDTAGNVIHMLIILFALLLLPIKWVQGHYSRTILYTVGVLCGASRLHTPLFALAAPLIAVTVLNNSAGNISKCIRYVIILCMVLYTIPFTVANKSRSLISLDWKQKNRVELYFQNRNNLFADYSSAMNALEEKDNGEVGLYLNADDWEYPFWVFTGKAEKTKDTINFNHVGVTNISGTKNDLLLPLYVVATKSLSKWEYAQKYAPVYTTDHVSVFRKLEHNP
jgi:hypothetical protein